MEIDIKSAYDDLANVKLLFNEYTTILGVNLNFQDMMMNKIFWKVCYVLWKIIYCIL